MEILTESYFATLDKPKTLDLVEGFGAQFCIEFRDAAGGFIDRVHGTQLACRAESVRRGIPVSAIRVTGKAQ